MNLAQLRAFHAVAAHRTFSAAAIALGISQSAVTQNIRALETALGARLFHRGRSAVELTADAHDLFPMVRRAVLSLEDLSGRMDQGRALQTAHLSLGMCAPQVVMPIIKHFRAHQEGIRIETRLDNSEQLLDLVAEHRIDVAVATMVTPRPDLFCMRLAEQKLVALVPRDHPWSSYPSIEIAELVGTTIVMREHGSMTRRLFEGALRGSGLSVKDQFMLATRESMKEAVAAGIGVGVVLDKEVGSDTRLVPLRISNLDVRSDEFLVAHPELVEFSAIQAFIASAMACYPIPPEASECSGIAAGTSSSGHDEAAQKQQA